MGDERRPSEDRLGGEIVEPSVAEERVPSRAAEEATRRAGSAAVNRVVGESMCTVRLPIDEEHAAGADGETQVQIDTGRGTVQCQGVYDGQTKSLYVRLVSAQMREMFPARVAEPSRGKRGLPLADGVSLRGGGLTFEPEPGTLVSVRPKGNGWRVMVGRSF